MTIQNPATIAFNRQAPVFDSIYGLDTIIRYKRTRVREHVQHFLEPQSNILELNAGTGEDAIYFASLGHRVHATDISPAMQAVLTEKVKASGYTHRISSEICSYAELELLTHPQEFDHIFSNFAGLNCTDKLDKVLESFYHLLKPGGTCTLVVLPKFCLWETLLLFRGKFSTAFRRFTGKKGAKAHIEGVHFRCWYYNPGYLRKHLGIEFSMEKLEGLCTIVPPSYMEGFAEKHPRLYKFLVNWENRLKSVWPFRVCGDYYIVTFRKEKSGVGSRKSLESVKLGPPKANS